MSIYNVLLGVSGASSSAIPICATGGTITTSGNYKIHTFTSSGTFTVNNAGTLPTVQYLIVSGGHGGNTCFCHCCSNSPWGAGGPAGGYNTDVAGVSATSYTITVGGGGSANNSGSASLFGSISPTSHQLNNCGQNSYTCNPAPYRLNEAGGGGAGQQGGSIQRTCGYGGNGLTYALTGSAYGGGGGGGRYSGSYSGGSGGGGNSNTSGASNTGGGGGGRNNGGSAGNGGSGVVVISYPYNLGCAVPVQYTIVAGGGSSGSNRGGGGGSGGMLQGVTTLTKGTTYTVTVGGGGAAVCSGNGNNGSNSALGCFTAYGGGYGSTVNNDSGSGGSAGGTSNTLRYGYQYTLPGNSVSGQGSSSPVVFAYGFSCSVQRRSAGGGGAGTSGGSPNSYSPSKGVINFPGGCGGNGRTTNISGSCVTYGGGGGGAGTSTCSSQRGGSGGGGAGSAGSAATAGGTNTGGGGGGGGTGGNGGSGIVILKFPKSYTPSTTTGSPTITTSGSYSIYTYTASGSIKF